MASQNTTNDAFAADDSPKKRSLSRRRILGEGGALLGGAIMSSVAGGQAMAEPPAPKDANLPPNVPEWMRTPGADGLPLKGTSVSAAAALTSPMATVADVTVHLDPIQTAGKTAVLLEYQVRRKAARKP